MSDKNYSLANDGGKEGFVAPSLPYRPVTPAYSPEIALIGSGGITKHHLDAYKKAGLKVTAICDVDGARAEEKRAEFYPEAKVYTDYHQVLALDSIEVVDIAPHPEHRVPIVIDAVKAGKHVLSQKPFALHLDQAEEIVNLAEQKGVKVAVNQNGRWAPHFSYMRQAVSSGLIGDVLGVHLAIHWNHDWVAGTPFDNIHHVVLYDFAIHWFDILNCFMGDRKATRVYASNSMAMGQTAKPPLLGQAIVEFEGAQSTLVFDAFTKYGGFDTTFIAGTKGAIRSQGPSIDKQTVTITTEAGSDSPVLEGAWFNDGFHGTMGELLSAIEQNREPSNSARNNLRSLELCFASLKSADTGTPQIPGCVRSVN